MIPLTNSIVFDIETLPNIEENDTLKQLLEYKLRNTPEEEKNAKRLQYMFHEPQFSRVCCITAIWCSPEGKTIEKTFFSRTDERYVVSSFIEWISKFSGIYVTYNGLDFDVPYLLFKCAQYQIEPPQRFCNLIRFKYNPHYDLMQLLSSWGKFRISLAEACTVFDIPNSKDFLYGKDVLSFLLEATDDEIQLYNQEDVRSTFQLFTKVYNIYQ